MPPPVPPLPPEEQKPTRSFLPIALALAVLLLVCTGLFFLSLGFFGVVLVMGGGVFAVAALHYIVWGWWLSKIIRDDVEAEEAEERAREEQ